MPEVVDIEARDSIRDLDSRLTEVQTILYGPNKDNGMKHELGGLGAKLSETRAVLFDLKRRCERYIEVDRYKDCAGLKALAAYEQAQAQKAAEEGEEDTEVKVADINAQAVIAAADKGARAATRSQWITVAGLLLVAAIEFFKK